MKNNVLTVMKKEFARFFGDRRMLIMILLPGILIYVVYSFMGSALTDMYSPDEKYTPVVYTVSLPDSARRIMSNLEFGVREILPYELESAKEQISAKDADLCVVFPENFDALVEAYDVRDSAVAAPNIEIYYNSTDTNSSDAYRRLVDALDAYESSLANKFDIGRGVTDADVASESDMSASIISSMLPMLLMIFLYSGCMGIAPESIAGEKERGTIAALLVTPMKRSQLAIGKILSLGVLSFLSGLVSAVATILALPKLMGGADEYISVAIYSAQDYMLLAFVILSTILLLVAVISIISAFAKTVKEASTAVIPLMIIVMLVGVSGMFGGGSQTQPWYYLIPLYSSVQSMSGVFSLDYSALNVTLSCLSNLVYACIGGFALTKMFNSEKVMFSS